MLVVRKGGIGSTLLLLFPSSGVGRITVVDHNNVEVSNLHWKVIHTKRRGACKARSAHSAMRDLNPTVSVTSVTEPLTWENAMDIGRDKKCVVEIRDNPHTQYLINGACFLV